MDERIESYFNKTLDEQEKQRFELEMDEAPELMEDIAFYIQAKTAAQAAHKNLELERKHKQWTALPSDHKPNLLLYFKIAAAAVLLIISSLFFYNRLTKDQVASEASSYIAQNYNALPVLMGDQEKILQLAVSQYNQKKYAVAIASAGEFLKSSPMDPEGLKLMGFANLQMKNYNMAITYFHRITVQSNLHENGGAFFEALTYLMRNDKKDKEVARNLLKKIVSENQVGKTQAIEWLEKL
jgi:hypothetical protein